MEGTFEHLLLRSTPSHDAIERKILVCRASRTGGSLPVAKVAQTGGGDLLDAQLISSGRLVASSDRTHTYKHLQLVFTCLERDVWPVGGISLTNTAQPWSQLLLNAAWITKQTTYFKTSVIVSMMFA